MGSNKRPLKAYVRFDGRGRIVAGSLVLRRKMPKVGKWSEIDAYQCCVPTNPNCIEYLLTVAGATSVDLYYTSCASVAVGPVLITGPTVYAFCATRDTATLVESSVGDGVITYIGLCVNSTTTTTSTTTTSTTTTSTTTTSTTTTTTSTTSTTTTSTSSTTTTTTTEP